jgi:hypothetical protein
MQYPTRVRVFSAIGRQHKQPALQRPFGSGVLGLLFGFDSHLPKGIDCLRRKGHGP